MKINKTIILTVLLFLLLSSTTNVYSLKINQKKQINSEDATIKGTVELAETCIPAPLPEATVKITNLNPLETQTYDTVTDLNGEFEVNVPPGSYKIFAEKKGYRSISPRIPYFEKVTSSETYEYEFFMVASKNKKVTNLIDLWIICYYQLFYRGSITP